MATRKPKITPAADIVFVLGSTDSFYIEEAEVTGDNAETKHPVLWHLVSSKKCNSPHPSPKTTADTKFFPRIQHFHQCFSSLILKCKEKSKNRKAF